MSAASLAHVFPHHEERANAPSMPDTNALDLMERLVHDTRAASDSARRGDVDSLQALLEAREAMLTSLEEIAGMLGNESPFNSFGAAAETKRSELLARANELQRANIRLMQCVGREAARLAASIVGVDRVDTIEFAYRAPATERAASLDLMR